MNDDHVAIVNNESIRHLWPPSAVLSPPRELPVSGRPLVNLSFALNYAIGGLDVTGYHVANVAIHLLCTLVLFGIVRRTFSLPVFPARWSTRSTDLALTCSMLWMVHPLQTEAINYLTQRTESMMALFFLLTLYAAIRARSSPRPGLWEMAAVTSCAFGMLCKESMATAPLTVALYDRSLVFGSFREAWRTRWRLYAGLAATWLELAILMGDGPRIYSAGFGSGVTVWTYLLNQTTMILQYLKLAVWPRALVFDYGVPRDLMLLDVLPQAALIVLLLGVVAVMVVRRPPLGFLGAWFFLMLAPTTSVVPIATEVGAERRMYLALAALVVLAVVTAVSWLNHRRSQVLFAVVCALLAMGTVARNREYASGVSLARTVIERWPHGRAHMMLGYELLGAGDRTAAMRELAEAGRDYPRARYTLGVELFNEGRLEDAVDELRSFITLEPDLLQVITAREFIGRAKEQQGRLNEAAEEFRAILRMTPSYVDAHVRLGDVLLAQESFDEASVEYRMFLETRPPTLAVASNLGIALAAAGRVAEALPWFQRAVEIEPANAHAHRNLANALLDSGDLDGAVRHGRQALALQAGDPVAHNILGLALASQSKFEEAAAEFRVALRLDSGYREAQVNLERIERTR